MFFFQKNSTSFDTVVTSHYFEFNPSQPSWRNFDIATCVRQQKRLFLKFTVNGNEEKGLLNRMTLISFNFNSI